MRPKRIIRHGWHRFKWVIGNAFVKVLFWIFDRFPVRLLNFRVGCRPVWAHINCIAASVYGWQAG